MFSRTSAEKSVKSGASRRDAGADATKRKGADRFVAFAHGFAKRSAIVVDHAALSCRLVDHRADKKSSGGITNLAQDRVVSGGVVAAAQRISKIGRASCRERGENVVVDGRVNKKRKVI